MESRSTGYFTGLGDAVFTGEGTAGERTHLTSRSITGPYFDRDGRSLRHGGGTLPLASDGPFIGPGHASVTLRPEGDLLHCHFYDATERGRSFLAIMPIEWDAWGWPVVPAAHK